ncbi:MAG: VacJ family lipoprotein [Prosthecobacter sp.]
MKTAILLSMSVVLLAACGTHKAGNRPATHTFVEATAKAKPLKSEATDDLDDYSDAGQVTDPLEKLNRATFWLNDGLYTVFFRPLSRGYEKVLPKFARRGIDNIFENVKYPVRLVNCVLQGKSERAGLETQKFVTNTLIGVGGLVRVSDKIHTIADIPAEDGGQTLAHWGFGHGPYIVIPLLGPSSLRELVGVVGDYAAHPANYGLYFYNGNGNHDWMYIPPPSNTLRSMPDQLEKYDAATQDAVDPYLSARTAYIQQRDEAAKR